MTAAPGHTPSAYVDGSVVCSCGWGYATENGYTYPDDAILEFAKHYATEVQAAKPRARRGGVDESEPTSRSHLVTRAMLKWSVWQTAERLAVDQQRTFGYTPQRIRTCLAGLVRAGVAEERRVGKHREYRLATTTKDSSATAGHPHQSNGASSMTNDTNTEPELHDSDRIQKAIDAERKLIGDAIYRCEHEDDRHTIFWGNIHRLVGEREKLIAEREAISASIVRIAAVMEQEGAGLLAFGGDHE